MSDYHPQQAIVRWGSAPNIGQQFLDVMPYGARSITQELVEIEQQQWSSTQQMLVQLHVDTYRPLKQNAAQWKAWEELSSWTGSASSNRWYMVESTPLDCSRGEADLRLDDIWLLVEHSVLAALTYFAIARCWPGSIIRSAAATR